MGHSMRQLFRISDDGGVTRSLSQDEKTRAAVLLHIMEESVTDIAGDRFERAVKELSSLVGPLRRIAA